MGCHLPFGTRSSASVMSVHRARASETVRDGLRHTTSSAASRPKYSILLLRQHGTCFRRNASNTARGMQSSNVAADSHPGDEPTVRTPMHPSQGLSEPDIDQDSRKTSRRCAYTLVCSCSNREPTDVPFRVAVSCVARPVSSAVACSTS